MKNKVVLITGSAKGIGKAIAKELAKNGYDIVINYLHSKQEALSLQKELIASCGVDVLAIQADVSSVEQVDAMVSEIEEKMGGVDVLVNNAAIDLSNLFHLKTSEEFQQTMNVNVVGAFNCAKRVSHHMMEREYGRIINISSVWGNVGASCEVAYSACKGGINSLTRALGKELAPSNIQVNAIACGVIDTDMNRCFSEEERSALIEEIPAGRMGSPEEVASLAYSLATASSYLNGQILTLDGGWI